MRALLVVVLGCAVAACSQSSSANDLGVPDLQNATLTCPALASYCDAPLPWAPCAPTIADARASFCTPDGGVRPGGPHVERTADCGAFRVLYAIGVDGSEDFYYDAVSGALVAVIGVSANFDGALQCEGGSATFAPPPCQPPVTFCD